MDVLGKRRSGAHAVGACPALEWGEVIGRQLYGLRSFIGSYGQLVEESGPPAPPPRRGRWGGRRRLDQFHVQVWTVPVCWRRAGAFRYSPDGDLVPEGLEGRPWHRCKFGDAVSEGLAPERASSHPDRESVLVLFDCPDPSSASEK
jgi:hypothetical protein